MNSAKTGTLSGIIVWILACGLISSCLIPTAMMIGGFTSGSDFAIQQMGRFICPENTTPDVRTYATTTTDENGNRQPATAYVLQCKDSNGEVVMEDPVGYAFLWIGIIAAIGLILSGTLAFLLAAPAGVLIARLMNRNRKPV